MDRSANSASADAIAAAAVPFGDTDAAIGRVLADIGDARFVLLGEASHGTREFYAVRAQITRRLIEEKGFCAVAAEADWPDAWRVNCHVRGLGEDADAGAALAGFRRFPAWMWRNSEVRDFVTWLRARNAQQPRQARAGWYGLDLYSLFGSIEAVLRYLDRVDPAGAAQAREHYACFDHYSADSQAYGYAAVSGLSDSCEQGAIGQLQQLQQRAADYMQRSDIAGASDAFFYAQQNARLVKNAEQYYRTMFQGRVAAWNLRDRHMAETLTALANHLQASRGAAPKIVVWAHNSHLGDAAATQMQALGETNLGQLTRRAYPEQTFLLGFSTYTGSVTAASHWDGPAQCKQVRPALPGSVEHMLHTALGRDAYVPFASDSAAAQALAEPLLERAIGVLYLPHTERQSHYFLASVSSQFDGLIHIENSTALPALDAQSDGGSEPPETYPSGV
ncbi:erythromycin esterase family protein [Massilia sp. CF038]|uniref:erythromycin esterase family protein n=1 Tax=Massilia sp. CF038 TaxID=1881045 RepID=UPI0009182F39|nr:erythromycin esterase family protein [Massilia sp. CF038]SHG67017.1 Erythromycin esterase homolog [Massilia sp. CF038]